MWLRSEKIQWYSRYRIYIYFKGCSADATSGGVSRQPYKVTSTYIAGKKRSSDLDKQQSFILMVKLDRNGYLSDLPTYRNEVHCPCRQKVFTDGARLLALEC